MKKIKLLTPILGLTTVATAVVPMATSCTSTGGGETTTDHVQAPANDTATLKLKKASYTMVLDGTNYDESNFVVSVSVPSTNSNTKIYDSDFKAEWTLVGDNILTVTVKYIGSGSLDAGVYALTLNVSYGSEWTQAISVNLRVANSSVVEMDWAQTWPDNLYPQSCETPIDEGDSLTVICDYSCVPGEYQSKVASYCEFYIWSDIEDDDEWYFRELIPYKNGVKMTEGEDYRLCGSDSSGFNGIRFTPNFKTSDVLTIVCKGAKFSLEDAVFYMYGFH